MSMPNGTDNLAVTPPVDLAAIRRRHEDYERSWTTEPRPSATMMAIQACSSAGDVPALLAALDAARERIALLESELWPTGGGGYRIVRWRHYYLTEGGGSVEFDSLERAQEWHELYCVDRSPIDPPPPPCVIQRADSTSWPNGAEWRGPWTEVQP